MTEIINPPYAEGALHQGCGGLLVYFGADKEDAPCERCAACHQKGHVQFEHTERGWEFIFDDVLEAQRKARQRKRFAGSFEAKTGRKD